MFGSKIITRTRTFFLVFAHKPTSTHSGTGHKNSIVFRDEITTHTCALSLVCTHALTRTQSDARQTLCIVF